MRLAPASARIERAFWTTIFSVLLFATLGLAVMSWLELGRFGLDAQLDRKFEAGR